MYEELIYWMESLAIGTAGRKVARAAADAIDALQSENEEKDKEIERLKAELEQYHEIGAPCGIKMLINKKNAALSRVEAERDAAIKDLIDCGYQDGSVCRYCADDGDCDVVADEYRHNGGACFKWCGAQGEEGQDET